MSEPSQFIQQEVLSLVRAFDGRLPQDRWRGLLELAATGEEGIALENLADNLGDYSAALSLDELNTILLLAAAMNLSSGRFERLHDLVRK